MSLSHSHHHTLSLTCRHVLALHLWLAYAANPCKAWHWQHFSVMNIVLKNSAKLVLYWDTETDWLTDWVQSADAKAGKSMSSVWHTKAAQNWCIFWQIQCSEWMSHMHAFCANNTHWKSCACQPKAAHNDTKSLKCLNFKANSASVMHTSEEHL